MFLAIFPLERDTCSLYHKSQRWKNLQNSVHAILSLFPSIRIRLVLGYRHYHVKQRSVIILSHFVSPDLSRPMHSTDTVHPLKTSPITTTHFRAVASRPLKSAGASLHNERVRLPGSWSRIGRFEAGNRRVAHAGHV